MPMDGYMASNVDVSNLQCVRIGAHWMSGVV